MALFCCTPAADDLTLFLPCSLFQFISTAGSEAETSCHCVYVATCGPCSNMLLYLFFFPSVQVVSMGLYVGEQAYLRSSWNILDGFLVFVSLIDIVVSMAGGAKILGVLRVLRLLRTLRPLRYG